MPGLYLLRHAKSDLGTGEDHERPLNERGARAAVRMGEHLGQLGARVQRVRCAPSRRTLETWSGLSSAWPLEVEFAVSERLYQASAAEILALLHELPAEVETALEDLVAGVAVIRTVDGRAIEYRVVFDDPGDVELLVGD